MRPLTVRKLRIGEGIPKICVPLVGASADELKEEAAAFLELQADMAEWRADFFSEAFTGKGKIADADHACELINETGSMLRAILKDIPLIFTIRTAGEGGNAQLSLPEYEKLISAAAVYGFADLFDVELFTEGDDFQGFVKKLHSLNVKVVGSSHDFGSTPPKEELLSRLCRMQGEGADVCKIAVMPASAEDVLTLLSASLSMRRDLPETPVIAVSMGRYGIISRVAGEYFGSDITFASAKKASAPGQISVSDCRHIMELIHG